MCVAPGRWRASRVLCSADSDCPQLRTFLDALRDEFSHLTIPLPVWAVSVWHRFCAGLVPVVLRLAMALGVAVCPVVRHQVSA